jgi:hypothetical protein
MSHPHGSSWPARSCRAAIGPALLGIVVGCADKPIDAQPGGVLTIGVSTTGAAPALAFPVAITPAGGRGTSQAGSINADGGVATFRSLAEGAYTVALTLPGRCQAQGGRERQIRISDGRTTAVRFTVQCG